MPTYSWFLAAARTMVGPPTSISSMEGSDENGYRFDTTRSMASMPLASRSARCSGLERSARIPPWILGWRVFTRPPSISGEPVTSATSVWAMPASLSVAAVLPLATSSHPSSERPRANSTRPSLS